MSRLRKCPLSFFILTQVFFPARFFAQSEEEKGVLALYFKENELLIIEMGAVAALTVDPFDMGRRQGRS